MQKISWRSLLDETKPFRKKIILGQLLAVLAVMVSLPIPLMFPLLIDQVLLEKPAWLVNTLESLFHPEQPYVYILIILFTTVFLRFSFSLLNILQSRLFTIISKSVVFSIRKKILEHLKHVSVAEYEALGGGGVSSKLVTDIDTVDAFIGVSVGRFIVSSLSMIGIAFVLLYINWQLALIILIMNPIVVFITVMLGRRIRKLKKRENQKIETFQNRLSETLDLFVQIRTHNQEERYISSMIDDADAIKKASSSFSWKSDGAGQLSGFIFLSGFEIARASAMLMVLFSDLSIGEMFAVMGYLWFMVTPLQDLLQIIFSYHNASSAIERLNGLLLLKQEPKYEHRHNPFEADETNSITLENIVFSYNDKEVLHDISLTIPKGKTVALLGHSGSGKTTLAHIVLGLYPADRGKILIDGIPIEEIGLDRLREHIALVLQTPRMFNDTLRQNLTLGRDIPDMQLFEALHVAQLGEMVDKLTDGLDTMIGKEGIRLSGGERQRLAIARMLVSDPNIVILDESTSALDVHTESHLFQALRRFLNGKTTLIIAHRLSTIEHADLVYVLKEGKIIESGSPAELLGQGGHYDAFVKQQKKV